MITTDSTIFRYTQDGKNYDVPANEVKDFEREMPNAKQVFRVGGKGKAVPYAERDQWLADNPSAEYWNGGFVNPDYQPQEEDAVQQPAQEPIQQQEPVQQPVLAEPGVSRPDTLNGHPIPSVHTPNIVARAEHKKMRENLPEDWEEQAQSFDTDSKNAVAKIDELYKAKEKELRDAGKLRVHQNFADPYGVPKYDMPEDVDYDAAVLKQAKRLYSEAEKTRKAAVGDRGFGKGLADSFTVANWDMGISDFQKSAAMLTAAEKYEKGQKLTDSEQALLDAAAHKMANDMYYGNFLGRGYKAGQTTGESLPFMLEFLINPVSGSAEGGGSVIGKAIARRIGDMITKEGVAKTAAKTAGRVAGDIASSALMTGTTGAIGTIADAFERKVGDVKFKETQDGIKFDGVEGGEETFWGAFAKAYGARTIENFSEMFGEYFAPIRSASAGAVKWMNSKIGLEKVNKFIENIGTAEWMNAVNHFLNKTHWNGIGGEFGEEIVGGVMNALTVGDQELNTGEKGVFNRDNLIDTFLGVAAFGGFVSAVKTAGYRTPRQQNETNRQKMSEQAAPLFAEEGDWQQIQQQLDAADENQLKVICATATQPGSAYTEDQQKAILRYAELCEERIGMEKGRAKKEEESPEMAQLDAIYDAAVTTHDPEEKRAAKVEYDKALEGLSALSEEDIAALDKDPSYAQMFEGDPIKPAVDRYVKARAALTGINDSINADMESDIAAAHQDIDAKTAEDGNYYDITLKDGTQVGMKSGVLAHAEDGSVDKQNSGDKIYVIYPDGTVKMVAPKEVRSFTMAPAADLKAQAEQQIRQAYQQQLADDINTPTKQEVADSLTGEEDAFNVNGQTVMGTAVQVTQDGNVIIELSQPVTKADGTQQSVLNVPIAEFSKMRMGTVAPTPKVEEQPVEAAEKPAEQPEAAAQEETPAEAEVQPQPAQSPTETDFRGKPLPVREDGKVDQKALFENDPEAWAEWNNKRRADDGSDSRNYIKGEIKRKEKEIAELQKKYAGESDFDKRDELSDQIKAAQQRIAALQQASDKVEARARIREQRELEPQSLDELVAQYLAAYKGSLDKEDFQRETGYSDADLSGFVGGFVKGNPDAVGVSRLAEIIKESDDTGLTSALSDMDIRDAILDVMGTVKTWGEVNNYVKNKRAAQKEEEERQRQEEAAGTPTQELINEERERQQQEFEQNTADYAESIQQPGEIAEIPAEISETQAKISEEEAKVDTEPTEAQKEAGNYRKGHIKLDGFDITIEQPKGSVRSGVDAHGREWSQTMNNTYGYIRGTEGVDGDHIDVFLSDNPEEGNIFVVDRLKQDGSFDEHKVMYGFPDMQAAQQAYLSNYEEGWTGLGAITEVTKDEFRKWVESSHRKTKPFSEYKTVKPEGDVQLGQNSGEIAQESPEIAQSGETVGPQAEAANAFAEAAGVPAATEGADTQQVAEEVPQPAADTAETEAAETQEVAEQPAETAAQPAETAEEKPQEPDIFNQPKEEETQEQPTEEQPKQEEPKAEEKQRPYAQVHKKVDKLSDALNTPIVVHDDITTVTDEQAKEAIAKGENVKGWKEDDGSVHIYAPNATSLRDVEQTIFHELVGHKGMEDLLGTARYNELCDRVWQSMSYDQKRSWLGYVSHIQQRKHESEEAYLVRKARAAADEYIANIAENMTTEDFEKAPSVWKEIVEFFRKALGLESTDAEISELLRQSYRNLAQRKAESRQDLSEDAKKAIELGRTIDEKWREWLMNRDVENNYAERAALASQLRDLLRNLDDEELKRLLQETKGEMKRETQGELEFRDRQRRNTDVGRAIAGVQTLPAVKANPLGKFDIFAYTSTDKTRPVMAGVFHDGGFAVSSDAGVLIADKASYDAKQEGKIVGKDGKAIDGQYPDWKSLFVGLSEEEAPMDIAGLRDFIASAQAAAEKRWQEDKAKGLKVGSKKDALNKSNVYVKVGDQSYRFPLGRLSRFVDYAAKVGATGFKTNGRGMIAVETENGKAVLMSMYADQMQGSVEDVSTRLNEDFGVYSYWPESEQKQAPEETKEEAPAETPAEEPAEEPEAEEPAEETPEESTEDSEAADEDEQPEEKAAGKAVRDGKIDDFGEKIAGARKDLYRDKIRSSRNYSAQDLKDLKDPDKVFSRKNIIKAWAEGNMTKEDAQALLAMNMAARNDGTSDMRALALVKYRDMAVAWEAGEPVALEITDTDIDDMISKLGERAKTRPDIKDAERRSIEYFISKPFNDYRATYAALDYPAVNRELKSAYIRPGTHDGKFWVVGNQRATRGWPFSTFDAAVEKMKKSYPEIVNTAAAVAKNKKEGDKIGNMSVVKDKYGWYRVRSGYIPGEIYLSKKFYNKAEAEKYLKENADMLIERENRMAEALMGSNIGMVDRQGKDYRGGRDITPQEFLDTFGPKGVQFGNWVPQAERQEYLNKTYDAIMDFCDIVGISPDAFFLGGKLGVSFGGRGHSRALAHYEPVMEVINLTRMKGAGSLAHEWFHALDNYLAKKKTGNVGSFATKDRKTEREELAAAFTDFVRKMDSMDYTRRSARAGEYWGDVVERAARLFENYVYNKLGEKGVTSPLLVRKDTLFDDSIEENVISSWPYPSEKENAEIKPYFDKLFDTIQEREENGRSVLFRLAPNGKESNLDDRQWEQVRTPQFKKWFGDWTVEKELADIEQRKREWLSKENLDWAKGKSLDEIIEKFGNEQEPVAYIPVEYLGVFGKEAKNIKDNRVYSGKGYYIDHAVNHHPTVDVSKYENIQRVINEHDHKKIVPVDGKESVVFTKFIDRWNAVSVQLEIAPDGHIVWQKNFYEQSKEPYKSIPDVQLPKMSSEGGVSSISPADKSTAAISLESRDDETKINNYLIPSNKSSKIVDENGEPLVVYHGSDKKFEVFNGGFFTDDKSVADSYASESGGLYDVFLNIRKPIVIESPDAWNRIWLTKEEAQKYGITETSATYDGDEDMRNAIEAQNKKTGEEWIVTTADDIVAAMKNSDEYDGVIIKGVYGDRNDGGKTDKPHTEYIPKRANQVKSASENNGDFDPDNDKFRFRKVTDPKKIEELENGEKEVGYRNVVMKADGTLGSPMADKLGRKGYKSVKTSPFAFGEWEESEENPDMATDEGKINLIKPEDLGSVGGVDYNPYIHIRPNMLNKQFTQAWKRPDLVYVETQYPTSELTSGYKAEKAALPVGRHEWNNGDLILSRWDKPTRVVPWEEVADEWVKEFKDSGVTFDIVPPGLLPILKERGVKILPPKVSAGKPAMDAYRDTRFRFIGEKGAARADAVSPLGKRMMQVEVPKEKSILDRFFKRRETRMIEKAVTRIDLLDVAKKMAAASKDATTIKRATGWEIGKDGKWRYEEPDIKLNEELVGKVMAMDASERKAAEYPISEVLAHDKEYENLIAEYPSILDITVSFYNDSWLDFFDSTRGYFNPSTRKMMLNPVGGDISDMASTLVHEVQHIIQDEEGFAPGGNTSIVDKYGDIPQLKEKENELQERADRILREDEEWNRLDKEYDRMYSEPSEEYRKYKEDFEKQSRDFKEAMANYMKVQNDVFKWYNDELTKIYTDKSLLPFSEEFERRKKELIQERDRRLPKMPEVPKYESFNGPFKKYGYDDYREVMKQRDARRDAMLSANEGGLADLQKEHEQVRRDLKSERYRLYKSIAGEVEARNVQSRMKMTDEERRASTAEDTEDIARAEQILLDDKKAAAETRFRIANENQEMFVSNAQKALEGIKQEKATPEQWLKMLEGGITAHAIPVTAEMKESVMKGQTMFRKEENDDQQVARAVASITGRSEEDVLDEIRFRKAYHGSGVQFDSFNSEFIGSGEGAQVHGYGHYVAFNEGTSKRYASVMGHESLEYKGPKPPTYYADELSEAIRMEMLNGRSFSEAKQKTLAILQDFEDRKSRGELDGYWSKVSNAKELEFIGNLKESDYEPKESHRYLYTVEIPDDTGDNYIDEGEKLSEGAIRKIADALRALPEDEWAAKGWHFAKSLPKMIDAVESGRFKGKGLYSDLSQGLGTPQKASEFLSKAGIVGIKYDGRIDGPCAVIFDEKEMKVEGETRFRKAPLPDDLKGRYEARVNDLANKVRESHQDSMLALKILQEEIVKATGRPLETFEDAYTAENQLSSKNSAEKEFYQRNFFEPMMKSVRDMMPAAGISYEDAIKYAIAKHGLERNLVFHERDEQAKGEPVERRDYSGLTSLFKEEGEDEISLTEAEDRARAYVNEVENKAGAECATMWTKIKEATKKALLKSKESGILTRSEYESIRDMFNFYVPLRGFDEETAEQHYEYLDHKSSPYSPAMRSAKGRTSVADDPFATIGTMWESTVQQGNNNLVKQNFLHMVMNHPNDLVTIRPMWYTYDPAKDEWSQAAPKITDTMSAEEIQQEWEDFNERMEQMEQQGLASKKKPKKGMVNLPYRLLNKQDQEHMVVVKSGGREQVVIINGNPRAAQALNGLTNPDRQDFLEKMAKANRWMAANFTTRSPKFVVRNLIRDTLFSLFSIDIKEDKDYNHAFRGNVARNYGRIWKLMRRFQNGEFDDVDDADLTDTERLFKEFMMNGGETGYTQLKRVDEYKKMINRMVGDLSGEKLHGVKNAGRAIGDMVGFANRCVEDICRLSAYMTSRQMGRDIQTSVANAKEISVNFNKKGSGSGYGSSFARAAYLFYNAGVQGLQNFVNIRKNSKKHWSGLKKFDVRVAETVAMGALIPFLNAVISAAVGGDDDEYADMPEWVRRNNLTLGGGGFYLTVPLPIELRALYGIGDIAYMTMAGRMKDRTPAQIGLEVMGQVADIMPLNPVEGVVANKGKNTFEGMLLSLVPDVAAPVAQAALNVDFTGRPIYRKGTWNENDPAYTKAYAGTSKILVKSAEFLNRVTGGDEYKPGAVDVNPAIVEHLLEGYFGGLLTFAKENAKAVEMTWDDDMRQLRNVPIANILFQKNDERTASSYVNDMYYHYKEEAAMTNKRANGYRKSGDMERAAKLAASDEYRRAQYFKVYEKQVDKLQDQLKAVSDKASENALRKQIAETKKQMVEQLTEMD